MFTKSGLLKYREKLKTKVNKINTINECDHIHALNAVIDAAYINIESCEKLQINNDLKYKSKNHSISPYDLIQNLSINDSLEKEIKKFMNVLCECKQQLLIQKQIVKKKIQILILLKDELNHKVI